MEFLLHTSEEDKRAMTLSQQALSLFMHSALALGSWLALMLIGYVLNPPSVPQPVILVLSALVPAVAGFLIARTRRDEMALFVWLVGLIWILVISLWILDLPTGPNACLQCDATEKLSRTLLSLPKPSGLIDNDGPFLGTWPAAALIGYSIGAKLAQRRRPKSIE